MMFFTMLLMYMSAIFYTVDNYSPLMQKIFFAESGVLLYQVFPCGGAERQYFRRWVIICCALSMRWQPWVLVR